MQKPTCNQEELKRMREEFKSLEKKIGTWFYPVLFSIEGYDMKTVERFMEEYRKKGFEFSIEHRPCPERYPKLFSHSRYGYYRYRHEKKTEAYLEIKNTKKVGKFPFELGEE